MFSCSAELCDFVYRASERCARAGRPCAPTLAACFVIVITAAIGRADTRPSEQSVPAAAGVEFDSAGVDRARSLFMEGAALARNGNWTAALDRFVGSHALHPHAVTAYDIGYCERALGHYTRARKAFAQALRDHEARGGAEMSADMVAVARGYLLELEREIARVVVQLAPNTTLAVDARPLEQTPGDPRQPLLLAGTRDPGPGEPTPSERFLLELDPGAHVFVVARAGQPELTIAREFVSGANDALALWLPDRAPADLNPARAAVVTAEQPGPPVARSATPKTKPGIAYVAMIAGATGLVAGGVAGTLAWIQESKLEARCPNKRCAGADGAALDRAKTTADVATVTLLAGGAVFGSGLMLWLLASPSASSARPADVAVEPWLGLAAAGCRGRF